MKTNFKQWFRQHGGDFAAYGGLLLCVIVFSIIPPLFGETMWSAEKISTLISDIVVTALLSIGAIFVYTLGHMDISIGGQVGLYATLFVALGNLTGSLLPAFLLCILISVVIAVVNGATGELLRIHPIISSLVFMLILNGTRSIIYTKYGSRSMSLMALDVSILKAPWFMAVILVLEAVIISILYNYTRLGKNAKAIGANEIVAAQCGINRVRYKVLSYVIMGVCIVVASLFQMGYTASASDATGTGLEMTVIVALILGGMPLSGGMNARVRCAVIGSLTYSLLDVGLPLIGVPSNMTFFVKSVIFIVVVMITCRKKSGVLPR